MSTQNLCGSQSASDRQGLHSSRKSVCTHAQASSWRCMHPQKSSPGSSHRVVFMSPQNGPQVGHRGDLAPAGTCRLVIKGVAQATVPAAPIRLSMSLRETLLWEPSMDRACRRMPSLPLGRPFLGHQISSG
jgi:hypothetical protein